MPFTGTNCVKCDTNMKRDNGTTYALFCLKLVWWLPWLLLFFFFAFAVFAIFFFFLFSSVLLSTSHTVDLRSNKFIISRHLNGAKCRLCDLGQCNRFSIHYSTLSFLALIFFFLFHSHFLDFFFLLPNGKSNWNWMFTGYGLAVNWIWI